MFFIWNWYNCVQIFCINIAEIIVDIKYDHVKPYNRVQITWIKNCYLKLELFTEDHY